MDIGNLFPESWEALVSPAVTLGLTIVFANLLYKQFGLLQKYSALIISVVLMVCAYIFTGRTEIDQLATAVLHALLVYVAAIGGNELIVHNAKPQVDANMRALSKRSYWTAWMK